MNAGQMIVQIPLGAMLVSVTTEPSPAVSALVGEQDAGAFAGILSEQFTQKPVAAEIAADTEQQFFRDVPELEMSHVIEEADVWADAQAVADPAVSLLVALGAPQQAEPVANRGGAKPEELIRELQQTDKNIPQKVEMNIVDAQVVLAFREDGRMPTEEPSSISLSSTQSSVGTDIPQEHMLQTNVVPHLEQAQSSKLSDAVTVAMQDQLPRAVESSRGIVPVVLMPQMENTTASELKSVPASELKPAPSVSDIQHKQEPLIKVTAAEVTAIQKQMPQNVESRETVSQKIPEPQMNGRMPVMGQSSLLQGQFASQGSAATEHAAETVPSAHKTVATERDDTVVQQRVSKLEMQLEPAVAAAKSASSNPAEFRFARSAAVDVALGNGQGNSPHITEKTGSDSVRVKELQPAVFQQPEMVEVASSETHSVPGGQKFVGFMQQGPDTPQPVQHVTAGQHPISAGTAASVPLQAVAEEPSRLILHENIAGQVRERISTHEIKTGSDQIVFRLSPENLGEIKVHLRLEDQRLRVEIVAENRVAREGLIQHMDSLKESLSRHNISIDKFTVTSGESQANGQGGSSAQNEWRELARNRQSQQWMTSGGYRIPSDEPVPLRQAYLGGREHSMLDVHF